MFCVGVSVVPHMHGPGVISDFVKDRISGTTGEYYVSEMPVRGLPLKSPVPNTPAIGIRAVVGRAEAEALLRAIPALVVKEPSNWNHRYRENMERLKSGDLYEVARMIKGLMQRESAHRLSTGERKMLHSAKQILISEIVLTEGCAYQEVEDRINHAMTTEEP